jgi:hypothetical protein
MMFRLIVFGRALRDGLLGKARTLFHGFGPQGEHPSRCLFRHKWRKFNGCLITSGHGNSRHGLIIYDRKCERCGKEEPGCSFTI